MYSSNGHGMAFFFFFWNDKIKLFLEQQKTRNTDVVLLCVLKTLQRVK